MHLQSKFSKLALSAAAGALATVTVAGPALAAPADDHHGQREFHGRVIARTGLLFRDAPNQGGRVVGSAPFGSVLSIKCKVNGQVIDGNPRWYKLTNGKWAWASARYIVNLDGIPPFCLLGGHSQSGGGSSQSSGSSQSGGSSQSSGNSQGGGSTQNGGSGQNGGGSGGWTGDSGGGSSQSGGGNSQGSRMGYSNTYDGNDNN